MLNWLRGKKKRQRLPHYSMLKAIPSRKLPLDLLESERSDAFKARRELLQRELLEPARRPPEDSPLFTELLIVDGCVVTIPVPEGDWQCLPVFSTHVRADDYVRTLLDSGPRLQHVHSTPLQL